MTGLRVGYTVISRELGELYEGLQLVFTIGGPQQLILNRILEPGII